MLKSIHLDKINGTKNDLFFLSRVTTHHSFTFLLICDSYMSSNARLVSLKLCVGFSIIFDSASFYYSLYFCLTKCMDSLTLKRHNSFQNENNRKATNSFAPKPLIFKLQQEILKFIDIFVSWSSSKLTW